MKPTIKVLLVDDDPADRQVVIQLLSRIKRAKYQICESSGINDARLQLAIDRHDVYLIDYFLGGENCLDLIRESETIGCNAPMVVIAGADNEKLDAAVMDAGAADYLPKDELSSTILERTIRHAIDRHKAKIELERLAKQDPLTKLANRTMYEDCLERAVALSKRRGGSFAVMFLDLDRFKEINDTLGHNYGDMLLVLVASRLCRELREEDIVARIGGDEFTLLLENVGIHSDAEKIAQSILNTLAQPVSINNTQLVITASIGISMFPCDGESALTLMQNADMALYRAKAMGKNCYQFFSAELHERLLSDLSIEKDLRQAIQNDELSLLYQSQVFLPENKIYGFEALIRWQHPEKGLIAPDVFISVAEKTGLIVPIGSWVLREACQQLKLWHLDGYKDIKMSINVSPQQLNSSGFVEQVIQILKDFQLEPGSIELEMTEKTFIDISDSNLSLFQNIRHYGVGIAIDDFGTGYSSLKYLKYFPVDRLKIDRSFVSSDVLGEAECTITQSIITLAHGLGKRVIAEGIETEDQLKVLVKQGCDEGQGFLFSRPVSADEAVELLKQQKCAP